MLRPAPTVGTPLGALPCALPSALPLVAALLLPSPAPAMDAGRPGDRDGRPGIEEPSGVHPGEVGAGNGGTGEGIADGGGEGDGAADAPPGEPRAAFGEVLTVALSSFPVRVVDGRGEPVRGLTAESFLVTSGDVAIPVVAVDWVEAGEGWAPPAAPPPPGATLPFELPEAAAREDSGGEPLPPPPPAMARGPDTGAFAGARPPPGRLIVLFVQADFNAPRIYGHLKMLPRVRQILDALPPRDRVAVVSFDSHLKLWQDFTTDRGAAREAAWQALRFGGDPPTGVRRSHRGTGPSLAAAFDSRALRAAAWAEEGLELVGRALGTLGGGEKLLLFVGWGLGEYGANGFRMRGEYRPAREALLRANVTVFAFDVMDAASHDLEVGLQRVAADTGGVYYRTATNPILATRRLIGALSGHYVVTVDAGALPPPGSRVEVQLAGVEAGTRLHVRPLTVGRPAGP